LREFQVPVYLLPGNHDPLDPASIYGEKRLGGRLPEQIHVLRDATPVTVIPGGEVVGAPWRTKNPALDPTLEAISGLEAVPPGVIRVLVAHGAVDSCFDSGSEERPPTPVAALEQGLQDGRYQFVALGDRHSLTEVGGTGRIWYPGTPESTRFVEKDPGHAMVVEIENGEVAVQDHQVGRWRFLQHQTELHGPEDIEQLQTWMADLGAVDRIVLRMHLSGELPLVVRAGLEHQLDQRRAAFAALDVDASDLRTMLTTEDVDALELDGIALQAANELRDLAAGGGDDAAAAEEALRLLAQLVEEAA
ncbi:MAG: hypothetical protein V2A76_00230, partial [Planctomycetota bacterium]